MKKPSKIYQAKDTAQSQEELMNELIAELNAKFGPFADNDRGDYDRMMACKNAYGKTPGEIVAARWARLQAIRGRD